MANESDPVRAGQVAAGKYRIEGVLGRGGMGIVVAAMHMQLDQRVALKFLAPEATRNPDLVARFTREARAAAKIRSEHVARVLDVGALENGEPYMVMERENLVGTGADDASDAIDRRVEFKVVACAGGS